MSSVSECILNVFKNDSANPIRVGASSIKGVTFYVVKKLQGNPGDKSLTFVASSTPNGRAEFVVKQFNQNWNTNSQGQPFGEDAEEFERRVQKEIGINRLLQSLSKNRRFSQCNDGLVCGIRYFNVVTENRFGDTGGMTAYVVYPYEDSKELLKFYEEFNDERFQTKSRVKQIKFARTVQKIAVELLTVLEQLHSFDIYHGDIKPENILVIRPNLNLLDRRAVKDEPLIEKIKLIDFDQSCTSNAAIVARALGTGAVQVPDPLSVMQDKQIMCVNPQTHTATWAGTVGYIDPAARYPGTDIKVEFTANQAANLWPKFDIYAAAKTIWLMLSDIDDLYDPATDTMKDWPLPKLERKYASQEIVDVLHHMTQKNPMDRSEASAYKNQLDLAFDKYIDTLKTNAGIPPPPPSSSSTSTQPAPAP